LPRAMQVICVGRYVDFFSDNVFLSRRIGCCIHDNRMQDTPAAGVCVRMDLEVAFEEARRYQENLLLVSPRVGLLWSRT
jgi:hypothetical protein